MSRRIQGSVLRGDTFDGDRALAEQQAIRVIHTQVALRPRDARQQHTDRLLGHYSFGSIGVEPP
jgi:hypothetical protein